MIDPKDIPEIGLDEVLSLVRESKTHDSYGLTCERARIMRAWYNANESLVETGKSTIIKRSPIESAEDYAYRLQNFDLLPFEYKFFHTQQRIYDENNVQRVYPKDGFWKAKEACFDDVGTEIDTFYRDKVLYVKEVEGFGAIANDIAMNGKEPVSVDGKAVPYSYVVQAEELVNFEIWYGHVKWAVVKQVRGDKTEYRVFTPKFIYFFADEKAEPVKTPHKFGQTPIILLKGAPDPVTGFKVGAPRRYNLAGLYLSASELFYDLKRGSMYFGHPIPAMPETLIKQVSGAYDHDTDTFNASVVRDEMGLIITYPDGEAPSKLFYQADMQGLEHLRTVLFEDLTNFIYQIGQVRDKSKVVHNASGRSKQFDSVDEQGLLAQTAMDMEAIERENQKMMARVRGEKLKDFNIIYSKHHDLASADETWQHLTEGAQYGILNQPTYKYLSLEYLRKKSAPSEVQESVSRHIDTFGVPMGAKDATALKGVMDNMLLAIKTRPELLTPDTQAEFEKAMKVIATEQITNPISDE